jgi:hypothetical protein
MSPDAPLPDIPATTDAKLLAGRYQILEQLGRGGMGAVYRARDTKLDRLVALKMLPEGSAPDADAVARFRREAKALARLSHPGIIQAYDSGEDGDKHFLVMELVEGRSLAKELADKGCISPTRAADYGHQAALALHHAHQHGLIHRDVKPSNLLVTPEGRVKVLDLGLARFLQDQIGDASLTQQGTGLGTPDYASPEQFRDARHADPRSDIYSLGCTLYHLIAGRVPFPGSSMSEKVEAHETREPPPLDELCPDMPAGLALAVQKMMAKRPADRFRSMAEAAEALAQYVATSSPSFRVIRNSATWDGSRLATAAALPRRRRFAVWGGAAAVLFLATAVGLIGLAAGWFRPSGARVAQGRSSEPAPPDGSPKKEEPAAPADDPNVLTVSQRPADRAKCATISAALDAVKPGQTIRIIDDSTYSEALLLTGDRHAGITLEATGGATLDAVAPRSTLIAMRRVAGMTLRGLRLRAAATLPTLVGITGDCPGTTLEGLQMDTTEGQYQGIEVVGPAAGTSERPITIRGCTIRQPQAGVVVLGTRPYGLGTHSQYKGVTPVAHVVIRDNLIVSPSLGVAAMGELHELSIVGNRVARARWAGIQLEQLLPRAQAILVANNTTFDCAVGFRVWDSAAHGKDVAVRNNLVLASSSSDMQFRDSGGSPTRDQGPGDAQALARTWTIGQNWREASPAGQGAASEPDRLPTRNDVVKASIDGINRDPKSPEFLRPAKDSPLATAGAGNVDPSLPRYVGALPPDGTEPWDWDRAWRTPKDAPLLTVSKQPSGGGKYRTINEALKDAKPWATIRVLDAETYKETLVLDRKERHEGLSLEAPKRATILLAGLARQAVVVRDVPGVRLSGFILRQEAATRDRVLRVLVLVTGHCPGLRVEGLEFRPVSQAGSVTLQAVAGSADAPVCVTRCRIDGGNPTDGIVVAGTAQGDLPPSRYLVIRDNRIAGTLRGVHLQGGLADVQVVGNRITDGVQEGIGIQDLPAHAARILVANNTIFNCEIGLRGWLDAGFDLRDGQVEVLGNLVLATVAADMTIIVSPDAVNSRPSLEKGRLAQERWRFGGNWRDLSGTDAHIPLGPGDHKLDTSVRLPRDSSQADFLRPPADSPLAARGAGKDDSSLPLYAGGLAPEGRPAWDWDRTWRARVKE